MCLKNKIRQFKWGYETPAKRPFSPKVLSPDSGCVMDYSCPCVRQDSVSPFSISKPALLKKKKQLGVK